MNPRRIMAVSRGERRPLFNTLPLTIPSPSSSMLVETHLAIIGLHDCRTISDQVVTLFLDDALIEIGGNGSRSVLLDVKAGATILSLREQRELVCWVKPARFMSVRIDDRVLDDAAHSVGKDSAPTMLVNGEVMDSKLRMLLQALYLEQTSGFTSGPLFVDGIEQAVASCLVDAHVHHGRRSSSPVEELPRSVARRIDEFIRMRLGQLLNLTTLANCAGYSPSHFSLLFKNTFGTTPHRYVQRARIEHAMALLHAKRGPSILDVALECGFQNQQHFSRVFRSLTGTTPASFRREHYR